MAFHDRDSILRALLTRFFGDDLDFGEDISTLVGFLLVDINVDGSLLSMHRLVQLTIHAWISQRGTISKWQMSAIEIVSWAFLHAFGSRKRRRDLPYCQILYPHCEAILKYEVDVSDLSTLKRNLRSTMSKYIQTMVDLFNVSTSLQVHLYMHSIRKVWVGHDVLKSYNFTRWMRTERSCLWLRGAPAIGKTLTTYEP